MNPDLHSRPFTWADIPALHELNVRIAADGASGASHIGDFYWALRATPAGDPLTGMRLWSDPDAKLSAAAWLDPPGSSDLLVAPDSNDSVLDTVLDWLEQETKNSGNTTLTIVAQNANARRIDALRRHNYAPSEAGNLRFRHTITSIPDRTPLPPGFTLKQVSTDGDIEARVHVETTSFPGSTTTPGLWRQLTTRLPSYDANLDLVITAPDGTGASACTSWYDPTTRRGEIEAVGTSPDFQRLGLGKAVIAEALRRLADLGATEAVLYTNIGNAASLALYRSCGFEAIGEDFAWVK